VEVVSGSSFSDVEDDSKEHDHIPDRCLSKSRQYYEDKQKEEQSTRKKGRKELDSPTNVTFLGQHKSMSAWIPRHSSTYTTTN